MGSAERGFKYARAAARVRAAAVPPSAAPQSETSAVPPGSAAPTDRALPTHTRATIPAKRVPHRSSQSVRSPCRSLPPHSWCLHQQLRPAVARWDRSEPPDRRHSVPARSSRRLQRRQLYLPARSSLTDLPWPGQLSHCCSQLQMVHPLPPQRSSPRPAAPPQMRPPASAYLNLSQHQPRVRRSQLSSRSPRLHDRRICSASRPQRLRLASLSNPPSSPRVPFCAPDESACLPGLVVFAAACGFAAESFVTAAASFFAPGSLFAVSVVFAAASFFTAGGSCFSAESCFAAESAVLPSAGSFDFADRRRSASPPTSGCLADELGCFAAGSAFFSVVLG